MEGWSSRKSLRLTRFSRKARCATRFEGGASCHRSPRSGEIVESLAQFGCASRACDVVSDQAAKPMSFCWWHFPKQVLDQGATDGGKGVAVVKAKGREFVALPAKVQDLAQLEFACAGRFPHFVRWNVSVRGGFMESVFFLTQASIDGHHRFSRPILQPPLFHFALAADLRRRLDLIFWRVETPSLLR